MADIQNERDKLLQAAAVRVIPPQPLQINDVVGLPGRLTDIDQHLVAVDGDLDALGGGLSHLMDNSGDVVIRASALTVTASGSVTLTAIRKAGLLGAVTWSVLTGTAALAASGDSCTVSSVATASVTVKAQVGNREAFATIERLGELSKQEQVNAATQIVGQLAGGQVSGLQALAWLSVADVNTHTVGALNYGGGRLTGFGALAGKSTASASTDVTGLGGLAVRDYVQAGSSQVAGFGALAQKNTASATGDVTGLGGLALQSQVNLGTQTTGWLGVGSISGLGSLATQSSVNGATQVTNLGNFAFLNALAANQIGAGTLAVGVQYAGTIYVDQLVGTTIYGKNIGAANYLGVGGNSYATAAIWFNDTSSGLAYAKIRASTSIHTPSGDVKLDMAANNFILEAKGVIEFRSGNAFTGSLGERILLKGVDYTAVINGVNQTFRIN